MLLFTDGNPGDYRTIAELKALDASLAVDPHVGAAMSLPTHDARIRSIKDGWRNTPIQKYFPSQTDATATVLPKSSGGSSKGSGASCFAVFHFVLGSATSCCGTSRARGSRAASLAYYQLFPYQSTKGETTRITDRDAAVSRVGSGTPA